MSEQFKKAFQTLGLILITLGTLIVGDITAFAILIGTFLILKKMGELNGIGRK